jgi:hypothetical protein
MRDLLAPKKVAKQRYEICKTCPYFTRFKFCKSCGCFMPLKTKLLKVDCPQGKWANPFNSWGG